MMRLATILLAGTTLAPAPFQDDASSQGRQGPEYPLASEVVALTFSPQHLDAAALYNAARGMLGGHVIVTDDETGTVSQRTNLQAVGNTLVIFDLPKAAKRHYELLEKLDFEAGTAKPEQPSEVTVEYRPRYLSRNAIAEILQPFNDLAWISQAHAAGVLVMRSDPDTLAKMKALLARVDVPSPQVMLTCYLISPSEEADPRLPAELTRGLSELTRIEGFQQRAFGMVRSAIEPQTRISMLLDATEEAFSLEIIPTAMDEANALTLSSVSLVSRNSRFGSGASLFQTSTSIASGEYTVLGAAGADPYFVVLRATPVRR